MIRNKKQNNGNKNNERKMELFVYKQLCKLLTASEKTISDQWFLSNANMAPYGWELASLVNDNMNTEIVADMVHDVVNDMVQKVIWSILGLVTWAVNNLQS